MEPNQSHFKIVPPIIFNEGDDVQVYPSAEALIRQLEIVDVQKDIYEFHDSTGQVLEARLNRGNISLHPTARMAKDIDGLRMRIIQVLELHGHCREDISELPLDRLAHLLLEEDEKARAQSVWRGIWVDLRAWLSGKRKKS